MASNNIREIKTRLSVDGETAFRKSIKSVDSSLKAMKSELKLVRSGFDDSTDSMYKNEREAEVLKKMQEQLKVKVDALTGATDEATKAYEDARKEAEKLSAEYGENSEKAKIAWQQVETLGEKMDRMATQSNNAQKYLDDVKEQLKHVGEKAGDAKEGIEDVDKAADNAGKDGFTVLKGAAANLVSDGLGKVIDSLRDITTELGNADSAYNNFAIKTGASAKDMEQYSDAIMELYKDNYGDSLSDVSDSMATVKQLAGDIPTDKLQEVTEYAIALDKAFGYDVAESMRTVNSLADQFGVSYSEAFNLIVQGAQKGLDQNGDMLDTFNEYSVQFKSMGYTAEEMFNMLANAAETGTWSVDKLGGAVKEFNINLSDGSADEALAKLGFGTEIDTTDTEGLIKAYEKLKNSQTSLRNAEINLEKSRVSATESENAYNEALNEYGENSFEAQKALVNMNSAYNNLKIAEEAVTSAQNGITEAQNEHNAALNATEISIDNIKGRLAAGGETAKTAQREVIDALMKVEDEQERYVLGQQLMGTMWEDLGETTVKALFNTQGEISTTKNAMQEVIDLKYDDIGTRIEAVGRKAKVEVVQPLIEKYMPKVEKGLEFVTENLDEIIETAEVVGKVVVTAFAAKKVYDFGTATGKAVKSFISTVKNLTTATRGQAAANTALNATNPWGWVTLAVAGVGALTYAIVENYETYDEAVEKAAALTEEEQKLRDATHEVVEKYNDWKTAKDTALTNKDTEFNYYSELKTELDGIVDKSGKIKTGYEERAKFITEKLEGVTGIELEIVDGQIQKYGELKTAIDEVLQKKKAEAYLGAAQSSYNEAMQNEQSAYKSLQDNKETLEEQKSQLAGYASELAALRKVIDENAPKIGPFGQISGGGQEYQIALAKYNELLPKYDGLTQKVIEQEQAVKDSEEAYIGYITTISNYENLDMAVFGGDTTEMNIALAKYKYAFRDATNASKDELKKQRDNYKTLWDQMKTDLKNNVPGVTKESVRQMEMLVNATNTEIAKAESKFEKTSAESMSGVVRGYKSKAGDAANAASEVAGAANSALYSAGADSYNAGLNSGSNFIAGLKSSVDGLALDINGHNVWSPLAQFALPHFATGTDNFKGGFAVINEGKNGELVNLPDGSQVIPHDISLRYAEEAASRANVVNNNFGGININISSADLGNSKKIELTAAQLSDALVSKIAEKIETQKKRYSSAIGR